MLCKAVINDVKKLKRIILLVLIVGLVVFVNYVYSVKFRASDSEVIEQVANNNTDVTIDYLSYESRSIRNILVERGNDQLLILLHGAPSSSGQWIPLVNDSTLGKKVDFLMIDRPGYGYSNFGKPIISIRKQAEIIHQISSRLKEQYDQVFVFGTSYGGSVASRLLMDYPEFLDGAVLMSSSMAPGEEYIYPISYFIEKYPWLFPELLVVANKEKLSHFSELKKMEPLWSKIVTPILFIHSTADDLIYPANIPFVLERLNQKVPFDTIWVKDGEHSLYWSDREMAKSKLNQFIDSFKPLIIPTAKSQAAKSR